jgi:hypothetical protein
VQGELFVLFELWIGGLCSVLEHGFVSDVSSCCPCLSSDLPLCLSFGFWSLVVVSFSRFFSFLFLVGYKSCVL